MTEQQMREYLPIAAQLFRDFKDKVNLSQGALSRKTGIEKSSIRGYLGGDNYPNPANMAKLKNAYPDEDWDYFQRPEVTICSYCHGTISGRLQTIHSWRCEDCYRANGAAVSRAQRIKKRNARQKKGDSFVDGMFTPPQKRATQKAATEAKVARDIGRSVILDGFVANWEPTRVNMYGDRY